MVFFLIPILTGIGGWLAAAGLGGILTVFFGATILSWLVWKVLLPIGVLIGLLCIGFVFLYYSLKDKQFSLVKVGVGTGCLIMALLVYLQFFAGYTILPGVFSFESSMQTMSIFDEPIFLGSTEVTLHPALAIILIVATLYVMYRIVYPMYKKKFRRR